MSSDKKFELQVKFKNNMLKFIDELIDLCPDRGEFFMVKVFVRDNVPLPEIIERFADIVLPYTSQIKEKNQDFFLTTTALYDSMTGFEYMRENDNGKMLIESTRKLWSEKFDEDDKNACWKWLNLFVILAKKYKDNYMN
jgi:hypothetical protein